MSPTAALLSLPPRHSHNNGSTGVQAVRSAQQPQVVQSPLATGAVDGNTGDLGHVQHAVMAVAFLMATACTAVCSRAACAPRRLPAAACAWHPCAYIQTVAVAIMAFEVGLLGCPELGTCLCKDVACGANNMGG